MSPDLRIVSGSNCRKPSPAAWPKRVFPWSVPRKSTDTLRRSFRAYQEITRIGRDLNANLVVTGSLSQVGKPISLDVKVTDSTGIKPPFSIFVVEDDMDRLEDAVNKVSKSLLNQIAGVEQVEAVQVKGNQRVETDAILGVVESKSGEALDYDKLDRDLRAIYRIGFSQM
jgi:outer membrane protein insertion porin family